MSSAIKVGDTLPLSETFAEAVWSDEGKDYCGLVKPPVPASEVFKGKRVVLFAVPGAFTPGCHLQHLQGFVDKFDQFAKFKVDSVACTAVNDAYVLGAWAKALNAKHIRMLGDGNAEWAKAVGLSSDKSAYKMGLRSDRYALIADDGIVKFLVVGGIEATGADAVLAQLAKM